MARVIRDLHMRPPVVPRHSRPLAAISAASDRLGIDTKTGAGIRVGHPLAISHVRSPGGGTCPGRDYRRLMVNERLKDGLAPLPSGAASRLFWIDLLQRQPELS